MRDFAQTAEGLGYSHLLLPDHVLGAVHAGRQPPLDGPYTEETEFHEPLTTFSYLAAITSTIEFGTGILILPQRQTALVAKQAAQLAILSGDRFRMAVGTGWNYVEYEALNETWHNRGRRQEEQIEVLRRLWTEPVVDFHGNWHRIDRAGIRPLPRKAVPIWLGGHKEVAFRRAARLGDGFIFQTITMDEAQRVMERMRRLLAENGRDPAQFAFEGAVSMHAPRDKWVKQIESWRQIGATHVVARAMTRAGLHLETPQDHIRMLETYWRGVHEG
jgi:probable F420-dependent oxidoreductase